MLDGPPSSGIGRKPLAAADNYRSRPRGSADVRSGSRCDRHGMTDFVPPVLVGIDGTPSGLEALAVGSALAVLTGSSLVLGAVYGYEGGGLAASLIWPPYGDAERWLEDAQRQQPTAIRSSTRTMLSTSAAHGLVELAGLESARAIVLGSSRRGPVGRVLAGSTARRVVHGAPCAVAVVPHDWRSQPADVPVTFGVAVTDSAESRDALALAGSLAAAAHAPLKLLTAVQAPSPAHPMFAATGKSYAGWCREQREDAVQVARHAVAAVQPEVTPEILLLEGDPVERLADASHDLDMLVVGSRRYGPLRSVLLGSVSSRLIDRAACPVVIVPRGVHAEAPSAAPVGQPAHA
jgi:nucleotide-binding universal stress UspA family protein